MSDDLRSDVEKGFRGVSEEFVVVRAEVAAQGTALRDEIAAQGVSLRGEIEAQGVAIRGEVEAQGVAIRGEIEAQGTALREKIAAQGVSLRDEIAVLRDEMNIGFTDVRAEIRESADDSRRYFQILTEQIRDSVKLVAEANTHHASRLDNHETRLTTLEQPNRT